MFQYYYNRINYNKNNNNNDYLKKKNTLRFQIKYIYKKKNDNP